MRWKTPLMLMVVALALGGLINLARGPRPLRGDEPSYHRLAVRLLQTGTYGRPRRRAYRAPLYPVTLAGVYALCGPRPWAGRLFASVLGAGMVVLAFLLGRRLGGHRAGLLAGALLMTNSYWWRHQFVLMQENLLAVTIGCAALALLWSMQGDRGRRLTGAGAAGLLFGLGLLAKPLLAPVLGLVWVLAVCVGRSRRREVSMGVGLFFGAALLVLLPWTLRNRHVLGRPVPFTTGSGNVFYGSHCPSNPFRGMWVSPRKPAMPPEELESIEDPARAELALDAARWAAGLRELRRRPPVQVAIHAAAKVLRFWSPSTFFGTRDNPRLLPAKAILILINAAVLGSFLLSLRMRRLHAWMPGLLVAGAMVTVIIFWGTIRFRYPLSPLIYAYAACFLLRGWDRLRGSSSVLPQG